MKNIIPLIATATIISTFSSLPTALAVDEYNVSKGTTVGGHVVPFRANDVAALSYQWIWRSA